MLTSQPITEKILGQNYCPACDKVGVEHKDEICEECRKEGWKWEECSTDRGTQYILTC